MDIHLKTEQVVKIISLIPKAFHAISLTLRIQGNAKPAEVKIYFSDTKKDLEDRNFSDLAYVQFKTDPGKSKDSYKPVYNCLDKAYEYCFIETGKPGSASSEAVLFYEGM